MNKKLPAIVLFIALLAIGLSLAFLYQSQVQQSASLSLERARLTRIENELAVLHIEFQQHKENYDKFVQAFTMLIQSGSLSSTKKVATLDTTQKSYGKVDTSNGFFLVSCQNTEPYLDGQKLTLNIGNPLNAGFSGFKVNVRWGPRYSGKKEDVEAYVNWQRSLKYKEFTFPDILEAGRWNKVEIVLADTSPASVSYLEVGLVTDSLSLLVPRN